MADAQAVDGRVRPPVIEPGHSFESVTSTISEVVLSNAPPTKGWLLGLGIGFVLLMGLILAIMNLLVDITYGIIDPRIRY